MAGELARLFVVISASTREFRDGMAEVQGSLKKLGDKVTKAGTAMTAGLTAPLLAIGVASFKAIQAASDLGETQSKVGVLFGESGKEIESWSATAATALGQSKQQAMDAAATFAIFGKSAGLSGTDLVGFSTELTALASDLASFNNTSPEDAINAIGSALRGEAEPMRAYGVLMDDASLRAQALKMGLIATTNEALTPQQKVLAAHKLVMEQTTTAQGDFQRTSEGLANQQRILQAGLKDTATEFGTALLPIALQAAAVFRDHIVPAIQAVSDRFANLSPGMQETAVIIGVVVAAIGPLLVMAGMLASAIAAISLPVLAVVAAIVVLGAIFVWLFNENEAFREGVLAIWGRIKEFGTQIFGTLKEALSEIFGDIKETAEFIFAGLQAFWEEWGGTILRMAEGAWENIAIAIDTAINVIKDVIGLVMAVIRGDWDTAWEKIKSIAETLVTGISKIIENTLTTLSGVIGDIWDKVSTKTSEVWEGIKKVIESVWDGIVNNIKGAINFIIGAINGFINGVNNIKISVPSISLPFGASIPGFSIGLPPIPNIPSLAIGTDQVNSDGLAMLHAGEMVMPADVAGGGFSGGDRAIDIYLDGRMIASVTAPHMVKMIRQKTGLQF